MATAKEVKTLLIAESLDVGAGMATARKLLGLTQKLSQILIPLCSLRLCGSLFRNLCVSPSYNRYAQLLIIILINPPLLGFYGLNAPLTALSTQHSALSTLLYKTHRN